MPEFGSGELVRIIFGSPLVKMLLGLMLANVMVGIAVSLYTKTFALGQVADWTLTKAIPYLLGAGAVKLVLLTVPEEYIGGFQNLGDGVWLFGIAAIVGQILGNLKKMGLPIPAAFTTTEHVEKEKLTAEFQKQIHEKHSPRPPGRV